MVKVGGDDEMLRRTKDNSLARRVAVTGLGKPATIDPALFWSTTSWKRIITIN